MKKNKKSIISNAKPADSNSKNIFIKMIEEGSAAKYEKIKRIHRIRPGILKRSVKE